MDKPSELHTIRNIIGVTRDLAHFYLKRLADVDHRRVFEIEGKKLNSIYWLVAHMAWAENNLVLRSTGGPNPELKWLKLFALGKPMEEGQENGPSWEEVLAGFNKVHQLAMDHLATLDDSVLDTENKINYEIMGAKTMRATLIHHIRHENAHIGQLGWLAKLHEKKTI